MSQHIPGPGFDHDPSEVVSRVPAAHDAAVRMAATTPLADAAPEADAAMAAALRHGIPFVPRLGRSLAAVAAACGAEVLLVLGARRASLWTSGQERAWHAGMGELRLRRHDAGERTTHDAFLAAADLRPGDTVLDATLGLGMDAFVAAGVVGSSGRVVGIEASPALAAFVTEGLARHPSAAAHRIEVVQGEARELLDRFPSRSVDVIVFDPMFRRARAASVAFDLVRLLGSPAPLSPETLVRARQVARRHVVVKDGAPGWDLARLGLTPLPCARWAKRVYGRAPAT